MFAQFFIYHILPIIQKEQRTRKRKNKRKNKIDRRRDDGRIIDRRRDDAHVTMTILYI
jgi:hypothetical protein